VVAAQSHAIGDGNNYQQLNPYSTRITHNPHTTMSKDKTATNIVKAIVNKHPKLLQSIFKDRDWLWMTGDYKDFPTIRETLKDLGFRFSRKGHELEEQGVTANWYHSCSTKKGKKSKPTPKVTTTATKVSIDAAPIEKDLFSHDPDAEFAAMFPSV
jgi:hypothetical protein